MSDSANVETKPPEPCEQLLDYVYGELDEAGKRAFEQHLAGCARCQAEAQSFGRVRTAAKRLMPAVEPTEPLGNALHAQLMHAAAQRQPKRGVLLTFGRKVAQHPAWAMAAMFAIVGGAITVNAVHDKLMMPERSAPATATAGVKAEAPAPVVQPAKSAAPAPEPELSGKRDEAKGGEGDSFAEGAAPENKAKSAAKKLHTSQKSKELSLELDKSVSLGGNVASGSAAGGIASGAGSAAKAPALQRRAAGAAKPSARDARANSDSLALDDLKAPSGPSASESKVSDGLARETPVRGRTYDSALNLPAQSPPPPAPQVAATAAPAPSAAAPPVGAAAAYAQREEAAAAPPKAQSQARQQPAADLDQQRKRADNLAHSNQCEAAIQAYGDLERRTQLTPRERVNVARCLGLLGKPEQAQQLLDALKQDKNVDGNMVQQAEREMKAQVNRQPAAPPVAAKKATKAKPATKREADEGMKALQPKF